MKAILDDTSDVITFEEALRINKKVSMMIQSYFTQIVVHVHIFVFGALDFLKEKTLKNSSSTLRNILDDDNSLYFKSLLDVFVLNLELYVTTTKQDFQQTMDLLKTLRSYYDIRKFEEKKDLTDNLEALQNVLVVQYGYNLQAMKDYFLGLKELKILCIEFGNFIVGFNFVIGFILQEKYDFEMTSY